MQKVSDWYPDAEENTSKSEIRGVSYYPPCGDAWYVPAVDNVCLLYSFWNKLNLILQKRRKPFKIFSLVDENWPPKNFTLAVWRQNNSARQKNAMWLIGGGKGEFCKQYNRLNQRLRCTWDGPRIFLAFSSGCRDKKKREVNKSERTSGAALLNLWSDNSLIYML